MVQKFIDLFCGIGGFHIPLEERGHKCVFASEVNEKAAQSYKANFGIQPHGDITKIDVNTIPEHDILCAGFPCQPFSQSGNGKGLADVRGGLFYEIVRVATHHQPKILLLENVRKIITIDKGNVWRIIQEQLDNAGYRVTYASLNAGDFGVPQQRHRIYFVAIRKDLSLRFMPPLPFHMDYQRCVNDIISPDEETAKHIIIRKPYDIVFDKPLNQGRMNKLNRIGYIGKNSAKKTIQGYRIYDGDSHASTQTANGGGCQGGARTGIYLLKKSIAQAHRIYDPDAHAPTQMAGGGGLGAKTGIFAMEGHIRTLHIDEAKAVMGFKKSHIVSEGGEGFRQTGNAVVPAVVGAVFDGIVP